MKSFTAIATPTTHQITNALAKLCAKKPVADLAKTDTETLPDALGALPCPFCREAQHLIIDHGDPFRYEWVDCGHCGAEGPRADTFAGETAVMLWNRRPA